MRRWMTCKRGQIYVNFYCFEEVIAKRIKNYKLILGLHDTDTGAHVSSVFASR